MRNAFRALEAVEIDEGITAEDHQDFVDAEKMVGKAISAIDQAVRWSPDQERRRKGGVQGGLRPPGKRPRARTSIPQTPQPPAQRR